ncbi:MAG TPA: hypothetical protein PKD10_05580 [Paracoccaceae bacterium]|nr:hypothetical protein [Paracoccaceae bacterium]HMO71560.1 hypothetical protein [Paracoccaceae bacterium]
MPFDSEKLDELKSNLAFARKRPLAFGLCLGKAAETTVLLNHKTKEPEALGRLAKKEGETTKVVFGTMAVEGKNLDLACQSDPIPGLARKTKEMLKALGLKMKVRILDAEGNVLEEQGDEDDEGNDLVAQDDDAPTDPEQERWNTTRPEVEAALDRAEAEGKADLTGPRADWQDALARAGEGDFSGAVGLAERAARAIAAAAEAKGADMADDAARWAAEAAQLRPMVEQAMRTALPETKKIAAVWDFAQSKTTGPAPDFAFAMKSAPMIRKLVGEVLKKAQDVTGIGPGSGGGQGGSSARPAAPQAAKAAVATKHTGAPAAPSPVTAEENARLKGLSAEDLVKERLVQRDPNELFTDDYMQSLRTAEFKGAGEPKLKDLMREIDKGLADDRREVVLKALAEIVGASYGQLDVDYERFLVLRKQQEAMRGKNGKGAVDPLNEGMHPDFLGSKSQLIFGKVLGDGFGIHPVLGALLSPTGGLVGPGNWLVEPQEFEFKGFKLTTPGLVKAGHLAPDNPLALHGTVHDAAGYLFNYHDEGPGYNYLGSSEETRSTDDPMAGQRSGIEYWVNKVWVDPAKGMVAEVAVELEKKLEDARDAVQQEIDLRIAEAKRQAAEAVKAAEALAREAEKKAAEVEQAIRDGAGKAKDAAVETLEAGRTRLGEMADDARRLAAEARKRAEDLARQGRQAAVEVGQAIQETAGKAKDAAVETFKAGSEKLGAIRDEAKVKLKAAWAYIWGE